MQSCLGEGSVALGSMINSLELGSSLVWAYWANWGGGWHSLLHTARICNGNHWAVAACSTFIASCLLSLAASALALLAPV